MASKQHTKISKHPRYDDPSSFYKNMPPVVEVTDGSMKSPLEGIGTTRYYRCRDYSITVTEATEQTPYLMTMRRKNFYPDWDYVTWVKYHVLPDSVVMAMLLPPLNDYINHEGSEFKWVFTFEQIRWGLDPIPACETCPDNPHLSIVQSSQTFLGATLKCPSCQQETQIDFRTWNELHGNGYHGKRT